MIPVEGGGGQYIVGSYPWGGGHIGGPDMGGGGGGHTGGSASNSNMSVNSMFITPAVGYESGG
jgi:hypothetical protein